MEFSAATIDGFFSLNPKDVIAKIAPRPIFIIHAKDDHVVPVGEAEQLAKIAGASCKLVLIENGDHFIFGMDSVIEAIADWLLKELPPN